MSDPMTLIRYGGLMGMFEGLGLMRVRVGCVKGGGWRVGCSCGSSQAIVWVVFSI